MRLLSTSVALLLPSAACCSTIHHKAYPRSTQNVSLAPDALRWPSGIHLALDYYPSQWPEWTSKPDVARMRDSSISLVRVNEFEWSVLELEEGQYNFTLLDKTLDLFQKYGIKAIVGTPTAAPPNCLTEKYEVNFVDRINTTLLFGSRRHYSLSGCSGPPSTSHLTQSSRRS